MERKTREMSRRRIKTSSMSMTMMLLINSRELNKSQRILIRKRSRKSLKNNMRVDAVAVKRGNKLINKSNQISSPPTMVVQTAAKATLSRRN